MLLRVGSDGDNIVSQFAVSYHNEAAELGVNLDDLYAALTTDAEVNPPEWNIHGRQVNVYKCVSLNSEPFYFFNYCPPFPSVTVLLEAFRSLRILEIISRGAPFSFTIHSLLQP